LTEFEWAFETPSVGVPVHLTKNGREVKFHPSISLGTVGLRGGEPLVPGRHYLWEIKMLNNVYGTDVVSSYFIFLPNRLCYVTNFKFYIQMVGIGTAKVNLNEHFREFKSLLGSTRESWGFSYKGVF